MFLNIEFFQTQANSNHDLIINRLINLLFINCLMKLTKKCSIPARFLVTPGVWEASLFAGVCARFTICCQTIQWQASASVQVTQADPGQVQVGQQQPAQPDQPWHAGQLSRSLLHHNIQLSNSLKFTENGAVLSLKLMSHWFYLRLCSCKHSWCHCVLYI